MKYIDTHAHLSSAYYKNIEEVKKIYEQSINLGVEVIINVATDMKSSRMVVNDKEHFPFTHPAVGVHPLDLHTEKIDYKELEHLAENESVVAIGEIGLDKHYEKSPSIEEQIESLKKQFDIALRVKKPVILHIREAFDEIFEILDEPAYKDLTGVVHTFPGNLEQAQKFIKHGFMISFSGIITFKNADKVRHVAANIPINYIMSETDSPYLTPVPKRGQRNYPLNVIFVVKWISKMPEYTCSRNGK